jgi:hypothetical protein
VKCAAGSDAPDRIVYQAWSWQLTTEKDWIDNLTAAIQTIRAKRPSVKTHRPDDDHPQPAEWLVPYDDAAVETAIGPGTDHEATLQDSHVPDYVDAAFAKVAARIRTW